METADVIETKVGRSNVVKNHPSWPCAAAAMSGGHETSYLVDTVGQALSKGVAATATAQPSDPVEYLAEWLLRQASMTMKALNW